MAHPDGGIVLRDSLVPSVQGGLDGTALLLIISIVGTTVAPWQLFFQQSNIIDKRITPRWIHYERADTVIGAFVTIGGASAILIAVAFGLAGSGLAGQFADAGAVAQGLADSVGPAAGTLFAIFLLDAAIIGAAAVTLATSYAFGDVFGIRHSLHRGVGEAKGFYASYSLLVLVAASIVLIPNAPLGLMTMAVQALAGVLLPSATVFLLLLCNDRAILGPWTNARWLNVVASLIVGVLLILSLVLVVTTLFPEADATVVTVGVGVLVGLGLATIGLLELRAVRGNVVLATNGAQLDRNTWRMPPLSELPRPVWSMSRKGAMLALRGYLLVAALLLVVKVVQLALGA
jgi:Mn2+/Fe2+ NRAMP family transporter